MRNHGGYRSCSACSRLFKPAADDPRRNEDDLDGVAPETYLLRMAHTPSLRGVSTVTVRGRKVRVRRQWFVLGPVLYLLGSAVVGTTLASRRANRATESAAEAPSTSALAEAPSSSERAG